MFVSAYVPLADAVARGIGDASARQVLATWGSSFEQSYREAFAALRVRGKRPSMVLDIPDIALRIGRLHGARRVELIAVDALRFDLGLRLEQRIRWRMAQEVALTERLLLWSALPSTTSVQLELLGRGPRGAQDLDGRGFLGSAGGARTKRAHASASEGRPSRPLEARSGRSALDGARRPRSRAPR